MREPSNLGRRLARHLSGTASEGEREALERQALEDDLLFDQLEAFESELVDAYVRGELDRDDRGGVARLLEISTRTRAVADTTLALDIRDSAPVDSTHGTWPRAPNSRLTGPLRAMGVARFVLVLLALTGFGIGLAALASTTRSLSKENAVLRQRAEQQEDRLARLEEFNRALALRLSRLEAHALP